MTQNKMRSHLFFILRFLVSAGLVAYLLWVIDWTRALDSINRSNKLLLVIVPLITLGSFGVSALRWKIILADSRIHLPWFEAFRAYVLALFYGTFLPGVLGGDAIRIGICVDRTHCPVGTSTAAVLLERIGGVVSLFCLLFFSYSISPEVLNNLIPVQDNQLILGIGISGIVGLVVVIISRSRWIGWLPEQRSNSLADNILGFLRSFATTLAKLHIRSLLIILVYCMVFQVLDIMASFTLARAIGIQLSPLTYFVVIPLTYLVLMLPISLGGLGLREGTLAFLLSRFGVATSDAVMLSFLIYLNRMIIGLVGGGLQLLGLFIGNKPKIMGKPELVKEK